MADGRQLRVAEQCRVIVDDDWAGESDGLVGPATSCGSATCAVHGAAAQAAA